MRILYRFFALVRVWYRFFTFGNVGSKSSHLGKVVPVLHKYDEFYPPNIRKTDLEAGFNAGFIFVCLL